MPDTLRDQLDVIEEQMRADHLALRLQQNLHSLLDLKSSCGNHASVNLARIYFLEAMFNFKKALTGKFVRRGETQKYLTTTVQCLETSSLLLAKLDELNNDPDAADEIWQLQRKVAHEWAAAYSGLKSRATHRGLTAPDLNVLTGSSSNLRNSLKKERLIESKFWPPAKYK